MLRANGKNVAAVAGLAATAAAVVVSVGIGSGPADAAFGFPSKPTHTTVSPGQHFPFSIPSIVTGTVTAGGPSTTKISSTTGTLTTVTTQTVTTIAHLPSITLFPCIFATCSTSVSG